MEQSKKYIFLDVDGVLTTGRKVYSETGMPIYKEFVDKDFTAMKELSAAGYEIIWISGDDFINKNIAKNRNYKFISAKGLCKGELMRQIIAGENCSRILAVGDDIFDLPMAKYAHTFYYPSDAYWRINQSRKAYPNCDFIETSRRSGDGVIVEIASIELQNANFDEFVNRYKAIGFSRKILI